MAIYYWLRSRNKEKPVTGTEYLVTIPLFLLFGWFTLLCTWLIHLARNKPTGPLNIAVPPLPLFTPLSMCPASCRRG